MSGQDTKTQLELFNGKTNGFNCAQIADIIHKDYAEIQENVEVLFLFICRLKYPPLPGLYA